MEIKTWKEMLEHIKKENGGYNFETNEIAAIEFAQQFIDLATKTVSECNEPWNTASKVRDIKQLIK